MSARTFVVGVGMTKFAKPGTKDGDYPDWASTTSGSAGRRLSGSTGDPASPARRNRRNARGRSRGRSERPSL